MSRVLFLLVALTSIIIVVNAEEDTVSHCPPGAVLYDEAKCLQYHSDLKTWQEARTVCHNQGSEIVMIKTSEMDSFISDHVMGDSRNLDVWHGINDQAGTFKFVDGSAPTDYKPWDSDTITGKDCGARRDPGAGVIWQYGDCEDTHGVICERPAVTCNKGWIPNLVSGGACYKVVKKHRKSFSKSRAQCQKLNGDLASAGLVPKGVRQDLMQKTKGRKFWIGVHFEQVSGQWKYVDGDFMEGEVLPWKRQSSQHKCAMMKRKHWYSKRCDRRMYYICRVYA